MRPEVNLVLLRENIFTNCREPDNKDFILDIFRKYQKGLYRFVFSKIKCNETASEITQESFLRMIKMDKPETLDYPQAYLFKVANNLVIDKRRRENLRVINTDIEIDVENHESQDASPEEQLGYKQSCREFIKVFEALSLRPKQVFYLRRFEHLKVSQTADKLGISPRMVHKHMTKALVRMKTTLISVPDR